MNHKTDYERVAVILKRDLKAKLVKLADKKGMTMTYIINRLVQRIVEGEIKV